MPSCMASLVTLTGLAVGLALKELRYAADAGDSPQIWVPRSLRYVGRDSAEGRGMLATCLPFGARREISCRRYACCGNHRGRAWPRPRDRGGAWAPRAGGPRD